MSTIEEAREQAREALDNHAVNIMETDYWCDVVLAPALRALLDATEPPAQAEPAEGEREALVDVIRLFFQNWRAIGRVSPSLEMSIDSLEGAVDDLIELDAPKDGDYHEGFEEGVKVGRAGSGPRPITDEMVAAADIAIMPYWGERYPSGSLTTEIARAALEAAEEARR